MGDFAIPKTKSVHMNRRCLHPANRAFGVFAGSGPETFTIAPYLYKNGGGFGSVISSLVPLAA